MSEPLNGEIAHLTAYIDKAEDGYVRFPKPLAEGILESLCDRRQALADELRRNVAIYVVEDDEGTLRLTVYGQKIAAVDVSGPSGIALLKLNAAIEAAP